jgi:hypothetical protein
LQVQSFKLDSLAGFGAASKPPLSLPRGDQERLLRRLELLRLVRQETARQETFQSITSVIQLDQVGGCRVWQMAWEWWSFVAACAWCLSGLRVVALICWLAGCGELAACLWCLCD